MQKSRRERYVVRGDVAFVAKKDTMDQSATIHLPDELRLDKALKERLKVDRALKIFQ